MKKFSLIILFFLLYTFSVKATEKNCRRLDICQIQTIRALVNEKEYAVNFKHLSPIARKLLFGKDAQRVYCYHIYEDGKWHGYSWTHPDVIIIDENGSPKDYDTVYNFLVGEKANSNYSFFLKFFNSLINNPKGPSNPIQHERNFYLVQYFRLDLPPKTSRPSDANSIGPIKNLR